jgi:protein-tyrosine phosphatase
VLVHCTSGKARTDFAIALVLSAVGVPLATVFDDYLLANAYRRGVRRLFGPATSTAVIETVTRARESFLAAAFDEIERTYGSVTAYPEGGLGIGDDARARLRENLTETDDAAGA